MLDGPSKSREGPRTSYILISTGRLVAHLEKVISQNHQKCFIVETCFCQPSFAIPWFNYSILVFLWGTSSPSLLTFLVELSIRLPYPPRSREDHVTQWGCSDAHLEYESRIKMQWRKTAQVHRKQHLQESHSGCKYFWDPAISPFSSIVLFSEVIRSLFLMPVTQKPKPQTPYSHSVQYQTKVSAFT